MTPSAARWLVSGAFVLLHWLYSAAALGPWLLLHRGSIAPRPAWRVGVRSPLTTAPPALADRAEARSGVCEFDRLAALYDVVSWPLTAPLFAAARTVLAPLVPADGRALDVACGPGREVVGLARLVERGSVVGVDLAPGMVALARRRLSRAGLANAVVVEADAATLPDEFEASFDLVFCSLAHHHFEHSERVAAEVLRTLRPGGHYAIVDTVQPWLTRRLTRLSCVVDPGFVGFLSPEEFRQMLEGVGFERVVTRPLSPGMGVVVAQAPH